MAEPTKEQLAQYARQAARQFGVPEQLFINLLATESGFDPKSRGAGGRIGIAGLTVERAKELTDKYGTTISPIDPEASIYASARYLGELHNSYKDWHKSVAAYDLGGSIPEGGNRSYGPLGMSSKGIPGELTKLVGGYQWDKNLPDYTKSYLEKVFSAEGGQTLGRKDLVTRENTSTPSYDSFRESIGKGTAATASSSIRRRQSGEPPRIEDFEDDPGGYDLIYGTYLDNQLKKRQLEHAPTGEFMQYLELVHGEMAREIELGNLSLNQANSEFKRRLDAYDTGGARFDKLLGIAVPPSAQFVPGREPGNIYGLPERPLNRGTDTVNIDPFGDMANLLSSTPSPMNLPNVNNALSGGGSILDRLKQYQQLGQQFMSGQAPQQPSQGTWI